MKKRLLKFLWQFRKPVVDWGCACGRTYLSIAGFVIAMEGDPLRDMDLAVLSRRLLGEKYPDLAEIFGTRDAWTGDIIKHVATVANHGVLP